MRAVCGLHGLARLGLTALLTFGTACAARAAPGRVLSICADPNNLPYSNERGQGFEDRIAALLAADLHARVQMVWSMQRLGFLRRTLQARRCDVVMGISPDTKGVATTQPYYRSRYVFVTVRKRGLHLSGFDDPRLPTLHIGLHAIGVDGDNPPPAESLAKRAMGAQVVGFTMYDTGDIDSPAGRIIDAVALGDIDVAAVWGPFAGYFSKRYGDRLSIVPIVHDPALPNMPFAYDVAIGVRRADTALRQELDAALVHNHAAIQTILAEFGVPITAPDHSG
jgi:quinoprotein dehydrogenase-associated probable ABC transporter substrate-binding protein